MTAERRAPSVRDQRFRYNLQPGGTPLSALASSVAQRIIDHERREGLRNRKRTEAALRGLRNATRTIVANLAHFTVFPQGEGRLLLPTARKHWRSLGVPPPDGFGKPLPALLQTLEATGILTVHAPRGIYQSTSILPTEAFAAEIVGQGLTANDFAWRLSEDCLRLTRRDKEGKKTPLPIPRSCGAPSIRSELAALNRWLRQADLSYVGNGPLDTGNRELVRCFNLPPHIERPCLEYGGRLFGGFWQPIGWNAGRRHIRIAGEPVAEADYGQVLPRLAYAELGELPPDGDLYAVPGMEDHRPIVKKAFGAMLFKVGPMRGWPYEIVDRLPEGWTGGRLRRALMDAHPRLCPMFEKGTGYRLLYRESTILCGVLNECMARGIIVLPVHDAVVCPLSKEGEVGDIMKAVSIQQCGNPVPVSIRH